MRRTVGLKFGLFDSTRAGGSSDSGATRSTEVNETFGFERCLVETVVRASVAPSMSYSSD